MYTSGKEKEDVEKKIKDGEIPDTKSIRNDEKAAAKLAKAEADRKVVEARTTAEAEVMKREVAVYSDERDYLRARLYEKTAPRVTDVVTADDPREMMGIPAKSTFANEKGGAK